MTARIIAGIFGNWYAVLFVVALCTSYAKLRRGGNRRIAYVLWGELLFYTVGIGYVYAGIFHAYFQSVAAPAIGWRPSPFEYELGWMEIGLGIVALTSLWRGFEFRLAATIVFVVFSLAAAAQHVAQILCCRNYAADNAGPLLWGGDVVIPLIVLIAAAAAARERPHDAPR
jgi:hypothetical protein